MKINKTSMGKLMSNTTDVNDDNNSTKSSINIDFEKV